MMIGHGKNQNYSQTVVNIAHCITAMIEILVHGKVYMCKNKLLWICHFGGSFFQLPDGKWQSGMQTNKHG